MNRITPLLAVIMLFGCANKSNNKYSIINEDIDNTFNKISLDIRLVEEISKTDLRNVASELKESRSGYNKIWIFYFLPGQEPGNGAWATTHFKPELEVEILGATKEATNKMNLTKVTGEVLNSWYDNDPLLSNRKYLVKEKGKTFMKTIYSESKYASSGGELVEEVIEKKLSNGLKRYDYNNNHGEYYLIEENGNLGLYDNSGKFKEAIQIE